MKINLGEKLKKIAEANDGFSNSINKHSESPNH